MCFSAPLSFMAGGGLALLGGASFYVAPKKDQILAAIPLLFGIQQALEGVQWVYLDNGSSSDVMGYGFLFLALMFWPIFVPTFVYVLDKEKRHLTGWFMALGALVALYFLGLLLTHPLTIRSFEGSIRYSFGFRFQRLVMPVYLLAIFGSLFLSGVRIFKWFGFAIFALAFLAWRSYNLNFLSVWCYFSAIVSSMFFVYLYYRNPARKPELARRG